MEYTAQAVSPIVNGQVKLAIGEKAFTATALFDTVEIPYTEVNALSLVDYVITIKTDDGDYTFSRMGNWCQPFYDLLCDAYNNAVLRGLFVEGNPVLTAKGEFRFTENERNESGSAPVHVFENCVVFLPPDLNSRRIPLCFVKDMREEDYSLTLTLNTNEYYTFSKLGYETNLFADAIEAQIRMLRERVRAAVKELDPLLTAVQSSQLAKGMPEGAAAPIGQLAAIAPSFVAALEEKLSNTRAADSYAAFKELCDAARIYIGFRKNESGAVNTSVLSNLLDGSAEAPETEEVLPDPYLIWLIAPSPDGQYAAVEFAEADSATFVYKTGDDFDRFAQQLNRALEAISFRREVIRLSDSELRKPENADYYMAAKRTVSLQFIRANFAGRVIHSSPESWRKSLLALWGGSRPGG